MESKNLIGGLLAGAAIGVAIGILLAPESGEKTRKSLLKASGKFANDVKETVAGSLSTGTRRIPGASFRWSAW